MLHHVFSFQKTALLGALLLLACSNSPEQPKVPAPSPAPAPMAETAVAPPRDSDQPTRETAPKSSAETVDASPAQKSGVPSPAPLLTRSPPHPITPSPDHPLPPSLDHTPWDKLLQKHVGASGNVNYNGFRADKAELDAYLKTLSDNPPADTWSRVEKMAYWINAYNACTIDLIADNYPVSSIMHLDGGKTWEVKRIALGGKKYSLNQIENEILRPQFQDARIHFALNCAAKSCPPLLNRAYTPENLTRTLEQRTRQFINDPKYNTLAADKIEVSKIFEWYAADFGDLRAYLNRYSTVPLRADAVIGFREYDWGLNE